ncbi:MAG: hypothetical protein FVQ83_08725 [Chloroflexi bacterium]|nr:hypothetical protein [Chloroflexota bacterium]
MNKKVEHLKAALENHNSKSFPGSIDRGSPENEELTEDIEDIIVKSHAYNYDITSLVHSLISGVKFSFSAKEVREIESRGEALDVRLDLLRKKIDDLFEYKKETNQLANLFFEILEDD